VYIVLICVFRLKKFNLLSNKIDKNEKVVFGCEVVGFTGVML